MIKLGFTDEMIECLSSLKGKKLKSFEWESIEPNRFPMFTVPTQLSILDSKHICLIFVDCSIYIIPIVTRILAIQLFVAKMLPVAFIIV